MLKKYFSLKNKLRNHQVNPCKLIYKDLTLKQSIDFFNKNLKKYGETYIGFLENFNFFYPESKQVLLIFNNYIKDLEINCVKNIVFNINPLIKKDYRITDLTSLKQLIECGKKMNHCVGGYFERVKDKYSKIIHIENNTFKTTVEFQKRNNLIFIKKMKSKSNGNDFGEDIPIIINAIFFELIENHYDCLNNDKIQLYNFQQQIIVNFITKKNRITQDYNKYMMLKKVLNKKN